MMKLKRTILLTLALILAILPTLALTSCHGARDTVRFDIPEGFDPTADYEITFWAKNESHEEQAAAYRNAITAFNEYYPNIKVNLKIYANYTDIYRDVLTNIQTGTTPNVCISYPDHVATYMTGENIVVPLDSLVEHSEYGLGGSKIAFDAPTRDEMIDKFMDEGRIGGIQYTIPYVRSTEACYVNKTYIERLGYTLPEDGILTWDFVWEVSEAAMEKNSDGTYKVNGQKVLIPFIYKSTDNMMIQMLEQLDAGYTTDAAEVLMFNDKTREILIEVGRHASTGAFSTFEFSSYPGNFFNAGQSLFAVDSTAGATWIGAESPHSDIDPDSVVSFETVVMPVPQYNPDRPEMISQGPSICLFNKEDAGEVMASWIFTQFLLTDRVQIDYATTEGYIPVTEKALNSAEYRDYLSRSGEDNRKYYEVKMDATHLLIDNIENTFITPVFNGSARVREAAGSLIDEANKAPRRKKEVNPAYVDKLFNDVTRMQKLDELQGVSSELGAMPTGSIVLLCSLGAAWLSIGAYVGIRAWRVRARTPREQK